MKTSTFPQRKTALVARLGFKIALQIIVTGCAGFLLDILQMSRAAATLYTGFMGDPFGNSLMQWTYLFFGVVVVWNFARATYWIWTGRTLPVGW